MRARLNYFSSPTGGEFFKHLLGAVKVVANSPLPETTREIVALRASQINGCSYCVDMHAKDAAAAGEESLRLNLVAAWREATVFTEAERAALALAEEGTRQADAATGVPDEVWADATKHFDEEQLVALVSEIALVNAFNRLNVLTQQPAGSYRPGQFD